MDKIQALGINKSDEEIHSAVARFAAKWQNKAEQAGRSDRISRF